MISLVTACMNREVHLRQTLPQWLKLPGIDEIVIVDWSTEEPFEDLLQVDERVRIVRAEDEPRWVLSYAYNLGIAQARGDLVLKCDADCIPRRKLLDRLPVSGQFFAGDWRSGDKVGKTCVNGQCFFTRAQWEEVNGYSEIIRRYGYDDTDFYNRLEGAGHARQEIPPELLDFAEHTDSARVANHEAPLRGNAVATLLHQQLHYHETINQVLISFLPWGRWFRRATFAVTGTSDRLTSVRRNVSAEIPITPVLSRIADTQAIRTMTARLCRIPDRTVATMDEAACRAQLSRIAVMQRPNAS